MPDIHPISQTGYDKLRTELDELEQEAVAVRQRVAEAREMGDLRENGEYIYGRQQLGFIEGRMAEIRGKLNFAKIVDCTKAPTDEVGFGSVVRLMDLQTQKQQVFQLLGPYDADLTDDGVSCLSPLGQALMGAKVGQQIEVNAPRGLLRYEIVAIEPSSLP